MKKCVLLDTGSQNPGDLNRGGKYTGDISFPLIFNNVGLTDTLALGQTRKHDYNVKEVLGLHLTPGFAYEPLIYTNRYIVLC